MYYSAPVFSRQSIWPSVSSLGYDGTISYGIADAQTPRRDIRRRGCKIFTHDSVNYDSQKMGMRLQREQRKLACKHLPIAYVIRTISIVSKAFQRMPFANYILIITAERRLLLKHHAMLY